MISKPIAQLDRVSDRANEPGSQPLLVLTNLSVKFSGIAALSEVSLEVPREELVAVIGPNGAGKSTLLNAICGIVRIEGTVTLDGVDLTGKRPAQIAEGGIGRSFQDPPLIDHYSVLENVLCGAHLRLGYRMTDQVFRRRRVAEAELAMRRRAMTLLELVGLAERADRPAGELPYGARKLVDIVRAMVSGAQLLLLDEPSSGLDAHERDALRATLLLLREQSSVSLLVVEHHMDLVRATASTVVALQAGQVLMVGPPNDVLDSDLFRAAIVGGSADGLP